MEVSQTFRNSSTKKNEFFAKLKPCCVEISKLSMGVGSSVTASSTRQLIRLTDQLFGILLSQASYDASALDTKIAEYVFFPLSFVFGKKEQYPTRLLENATKCLRLLIQHGWKAAISRELSQQLLILLTFIIGGAPDQKTKPDVPEEYLLEGYRALTVLIKATGAAPGPTSPLVEASVIPAFGHCITVILEGVTQGSTPDIQLEGLEAIGALYTTLRDREALTSFLPGTVSNLTRLLSPPSSLKTPKRVLVRGLQVLKDVLVHVVGDLVTRDILHQQKSYPSKEADSGKALTPAWLKATASQVKIALSSVLKLRNDASLGVRQAIERFCVGLLDECHSSLLDSSSMLVESAIISSTVGGALTEPSPALSNTGNHTGLQHLMGGTTLEDLASIYPELGDTIKSVVYNWVTSLPRAMQSSDEGVKQQAIQYLIKGNTLIRALRIDSTTLESSLATALRSSVLTLILGAKSPKVVDEEGIDDRISANAMLLKADTQRQHYPPVLLAQEGQKKTRDGVLALIASVGSSTQQTKLAAEMLAYVKDSDGLDQISSCWLAFELLKAAFLESSDLDNLLDLSSLTHINDDLDLVFQELYSFSVLTLASHSDASDADWRLEALALEIAAFAAARMKESFRPELIDVLYPVATFLGSPEPRLRVHAITTLNSLAGFCGYGSVSELIIGNVDYMVNSVALRLNTFDISPASTKVLRMMIQLTGPRLIPFLDDVVAAMFAALDNYHGYPLFVESLFSVLSEVVTQGSRSDVLLLDGTQPGQIHHRKQAGQQTTTEGILALLDKREDVRKRTSDEDDIEEIARGHPKAPWKSVAEELLDKHEASGQEGEESEDAPSSSQDIDKRDTPKTPTYSLLARITTLTQHYLTSPTPTLRKSLLDLLSTVAPALAPDEEAFLPLVNAVWPVVVARLYDSEPYVTIAACGALAALCAAAGDFLASRIKTEWWEGLGKWCSRAKAAAAGGSIPSSRSQTPAIGPTSRDKYPAASHRSSSILSSSSTGRAGAGIVFPSRDGGQGHVVRQHEAASTLGGGLGRFAQPARVWAAVAALLADVVAHVRLDDDIFAQVLDLLADEALCPAAQGQGANAAGSDKYRGPLEVVNADAVWLAAYKRGWAEWKAAPVLDGVSFVQMERAGVSAA